MCKVLCLLLLCVFNLNAYDDQPECYKSLQVSFFPEPVVKQAFSLYTLYQSQWDKYYASIMKYNKRVPNLLHAEANAMRPNPLEYPFDRQKAAEMLGTILFKVFRDALREVYVTDENIIKGMFLHIKSKQTSRINACFGEDAKKF